MATRYLVRDVSESLTFYADILGFEVVEQWGPAFAIVRWRETEQWLSAPGTSAARAMPDGFLPEPGGWNRIVLEVEDLATFVMLLREHGVPFRSDVISGPGGSHVLIEDPCGNPIELFQGS